MYVVQRFDADGKEIFRLDGIVSITAAVRLYYRQVHRFKTGHVRLIRDNTIPDLPQVVVAERFGKS